MLRDFNSIVDLVAVAAVFAVVGATGCGSDSSASAGCPAPVTDAGCPATAKDAGCPATGADAGCPATGKDAGCPATSQLPPSGGTAVEQWIATGAYKSWTCEGAVHSARSPSPHGFNRICSNDAISSNAAGTSSWPEGAAAVKELYSSATATEPEGYAVYRKDAADSGGGANWYWYERTATGVVADGEGAPGSASNSICVSCHSGAGSSAADTPSPGSRDFVYSPITK
jgi:hypothetical protein